MLSNSAVMTLDGQGRLVACEHSNRRVTRTESDGRITVRLHHKVVGAVEPPAFVSVRKDGYPAVALRPRDPAVAVLADNKAM